MPKGYKLNLKPYEVELPTETGIQKTPYNVKASIANILVRNHNRDVKKYLEAGDLAKEIENANGSIVMDEKAHELLKEAFSRVPEGVDLTRNELSLYSRVVREIEEIELEEKQNGRRK